MLFRGKFFVGGRVPPLVVEFSERAGGDVDVLRKPLILNPAGTEGQILINALVLRNVRVVGKPYFTRLGKSCPSAGSNGDQLP
jgi:hypothetical protein